jgi:hypothetical protein
VIVRLVGVLSHFIYLEDARNHKPKIQSLFNLVIALHVSGVTITHLQEQKTTVTTASGNHYTVIELNLLIKSTDRHYSTTVILI